MARLQGPETDETRVLVTRCRGGDRRAFDVIYGRYCSVVSRRVTNLLGPRAEVDDLVQETFAKAWQKIDAYRGDAPFSHWLLRIATNAARGHYRRQGRRPWVLWDGPMPENARSHDVPGTTPYMHLEIVHLGLRRLSTRLREAVILFEIEGLSLAELAQFLDVPVNTAASRVRRGRDKLRREFVRLGYDPTPARSTRPTSSVATDPSPLSGAGLCRGESR